METVFWVCGKGWEWFKETRSASRLPAMANVYFVAVCPSGLFLSLVVPDFDCSVLSLFLRMLRCASRSQKSSNIELF